MVLLLFLYRDDDRGLHGKRFLRLVHFLQPLRRQIGADPLEMVRENSLHFFLKRLVAGIDICKVCLAFMTFPVRDDTVERLGNSMDAMIDGHFEPDIIQGGMSHRRCLAVLSERITDHGNVKEGEISEIEIIANASRLVVDEGVKCCSVPRVIIEIRVNRCGSRRSGGPDQSFERSRPHDGNGTGYKKKVVRLCLCQDLVESLAGGERTFIDDAASGKDIRYGVPRDDEDLFNQVRPCEIPERGQKQRLRNVCANDGDRSHVSIILPRKSM